MGGFACAFRAITDVDLDLSSFHYKAARVFVEADVGAVEGKLDGLGLAGVERDALEVSQSADGLRDGVHGIVDVELHHLVAAAATGVRDVDLCADAGAVGAHRPGAEPEGGDIERGVAQAVAELVRLAARV